MAQVRTMTRRGVRPLGAVVLAAGLAMTACTTDGTGGGGNAAGTTPGSTPAAEGRPATLDAAQVEAATGQLDAIVGDAMERTGVPGVAVAVVHDDQVVFAKGYGVRNAEGTDAVDAQTVFQIASMSKPISSTVVSGEVGKGTIAWEEPVSEQTDSFELADPWVSEHMTYADLFSMRTGLPGAAGNELEAIGYDRAEILRRLRLVELAPFRDTYSYSNFGLTAGGELAAEAAGTTWEELAESVLFEPAGMTSTSARHDDFVARDNRADLHVEIGGTWTPAFERLPDAQAPAGGVSSNVEDLARWIRLLLADGKLDGEQIIDGDALVDATTPRIVSRPAAVLGGQPGFYALGWSTETDALGYRRLNHSGAFSVGAATTAVLIPELDLGIVVLTNGMPIGVPEAIADAFLEQAITGTTSQDYLDVWGQRFANIYGEPLELPASTNTPARDDAAYVGTYTNEYVGDVEVVVDGDGLAILEGPDKMRFPLEHHDADLSTYAQSPELPDFPTSVAFTVGPDGTATAVEISTFADVGQGTLTRVG